MAKQAATRPRVFLSYSHKDVNRDWLRQFVESLQRQGVDVWWDEQNVRPGEPLVDAVEEAMRGSDMILVMVSPDSLQSANLAFELGAALAMKKRLVAIVPESVEPQQLPGPLRSRRFLIQRSPDETARELVEASAISDAG